MSGAPAVGSAPALIVNVSHLGPLDGAILEGLLEIALHADELGFDQLLMTDHVVLGTNLDSHAALGGPFPWPPEHPYPDPLIVLAAIAAMTSRIRLTTGVLIAPLRPAVLLAKQAATLDQISNGRLELGVGTGWQLEEFEALGVPMEGKAARMDDLVRACRTLWRDSPASFESPTVSFRDIYCRPLPVQPGGVPFWFAGGPNRAVARRVAELGDGWCPLTRSTSQVWPGASASCARSSSGPAVTRPAPGCGSPCRPCATVVGPTSTRPSPRSTPTSRPAPPPSRSRSATSSTGSTRCPTPSVRPVTRCRAS